MAMLSLTFTADDGTTKGVDMMLPDPLPACFRFRQTDYLAAIKAALVAGDDAALAAAKANSDAADASRGALLADFEPALGILAMNVAEGA